MYYKKKKALEFYYLTRPRLQHRATFLRHQPAEIQLSVKPNYLAAAAKKYIELGVSIGCGAYGNDIINMHRALCFRYDI